MKFFRRLFGNGQPKYQTIPWVGAEGNMIIPDDFFEVTDNMIKIGTYQIDYDGNDVEVTDDSNQR